MIDRKPREGYGYGVIQISRQLTEHLVPFAQIKMTDIQGQLHESGVLEQLRQGLLLPDDYTILGVFLKPYQYIWILLIEAPGIPTPDEGEDLPFVTPVYRQERDESTGTVHTSLVRVDITENASRVLRLD